MTKRRIKKTRTAVVDRVTGETRIHLRLVVDGSGQTKISTPIPFFGHMLDAMCRHGNLDMEIEVEGDVEVDQHHTIEDVGLALGAALRDALGDRQGIRRLGSAFVPMDEALAFCAVDLSGRPYFVFEALFEKERQGDLELDLLSEFFRAVADGSRAAWHLKVHAGDNEHHKVEALFKSAGRALADAVSYDPARAGVVPSTKGVLE